MTVSKRLILALIATALAPITVNAAVIQFQAGNPVTTPDVSTVFASLPSTGNLSTPQSLDGFTFDQVNGDPNGIWTTYNPGGAGTGSGWYPNGGDSGFTEISFTSGDGFQDVGLFVGSGNNGHGYLAYELLDNNVSVQSGVLSGHQTAFHWLSITGGGFDMIRLRDGRLPGITVADGSHNALAFDGVYATLADVPEPGTLALLGLGLAGIGFARRRRKA